MAHYDSDSSLDSKDPEYYDWLCKRAAEMYDEDDNLDERLSYLLDSDSPRSTSLARIVSDLREQNGRLLQSNWDLSTEVISHRCTIDRLHKEIELMLPNCVQYRLSALAAQCGPKTVNDNHIKAAFAGFVFGFACVSFVFMK